jgi:hypothetical protein
MAPMLGQKKQKLYLAGQSSVVTALAMEIQGTDPDNPTIF